MNKEFDLNIEEILENWQVHHALREVIANAIDETILSNCKSVEIYKVDDAWYIRDFGRGLNYKHLTQNENKEKLQHKNLIGKFGVGLKDAIATFDRNNINVLIKSKFCNIAFSKKPKHKFANVETIHAIIDETNVDKDFIGTEFVFYGLEDQDIKLAKEQFLMFTNEEILDENRYGQIIKKSYNSAESNIYFNGVRVSTQSNFLFSYNITNLDSKIKKLLNREKSNVGRSAYSERIKQILVNSSNQTVMNLLMNDLKNYQNGQTCDELSWIDVMNHAVKISNTYGNSVFFTTEEIKNNPDIVKEVELSGKEIVNIPESLKNKIKDEVDLEGKDIQSFETFYQNYENSFEYKYVDPRDLTNQEKEVFNQTEKILSLVGWDPYIVKKILISETIQKDIYGGERLGHWDPNTNEVVIKRTQLKSIKDYASTLIHEFAHATSGFLDSTREFENVLCQQIGLIVSKLIS